MKKQLLWICVTLISLATYAGSTAPHGFSHQAPVSFVENKGQITNQYGSHRSDIGYSIKATGGLRIFISAGKIIYQFAPPSPHGDNKTNLLMAGYPVTGSCTDYATSRMEVELMGANKEAKAIAADTLAYYENYMRDSTGAQSLACRAYQRITYHNIYPGIDWTLYIKDGSLEYEFIVHDGGHASDISVHYGGCTDLSLCATDGSLTATTPHGIITEHAPLSFTTGGIPVASSYRLHDRTITYDIGSYDGTLIIDPALSWATYFGGSSEDICTGVAADGYGNVYIAGYTTSNDNIVTEGAYQDTFGGNGFTNLITSSSFLARFDSSGNLHWSTYYAGTYSFNSFVDVTVDRDGDVYITGTTTCSSSVATPHTFQTSYGGGWDGNNSYLAKFSNTGSLIWGTYYGGTVTGYGNVSSMGVALDPAKNIYITGYTDNLGIATPGYYQGYHGNNDAFLASFNQNGMIRWSTYYGGTDIDQSFDIATDASCHVYFTGMTASTSSIASAGSYQDTFGGGSSYHGDAYLARFDSSGRRVWGTYYGSRDDESGRGVATDIYGNVFITGIDETYFGPGFVCKFDSGGHKQWTYSSTAFLGFAISANDLGEVFVAGRDSGLAYWATFDHAGHINEQAYFGTYPTDAWAIAADDNHNVYLSGGTMAMSGVATPGAYQTVYGGSVDGDGFLAKYHTAVLGLDNNKAYDYHVQLSPNPASGSVHIHTDYLGPVTMRITSILGQTLMNYTLNTTDEVIDISSLSHGIYQMVFSDQISQHTEKLIIQ